MLVGEANLFAYVALFLWVPVTFVAFKRLRPAMAAAVCLIGGTLFLPESTAIDPPLLPPIDKASMAAFWAFVAAMWVAREQLRRARPLRGLDALFLLVLVGNVGTALSNQQPLVTGSVVRQGLTLYDAFALGIKDTLVLYLPFLLGRAMFRSSRDLRDLLRVLVVAGLIYSVFALVEVRLSPQSHRWFYGFHQTNFGMTMRFGGYRPLVFMLTGMAVAMFFLSAAIAATARWRAGLGKPWTPLYLGLVLLACKSTGAIVYGVAVLPLVALRKNTKLWLPAALGALVLLYPALRSADLFPADTLVSWAEHISEERALSLWFRFDQEEQLLERARERLWFGWGTYGRNRVFDPETGRDLSVTDGDWIIQLGSRGLFGFVGLYGMLSLALIVAARRANEIRSQRTRILYGGLALISALLTIDLLPNGLFHHLPFFFAGAVAGLSRGLVREEKKRRAAARRERALEESLGEAQLTSAEPRVRRLPAAGVGA